MGSAAADCKLGKLSGRNVVAWWEGDRRRRFHLRLGVSQAALGAEVSRQDLLLPLLKLWRGSTTRQAAFP